MLLTYAWLLEDIHSLYYNHQLKDKRKFNRYILCNCRFCKLLSKASTFFVPSTTTLTIQSPCLLTFKEPRNRFLPAYSDGGPVRQIGLSHGPLGIDFCAPYQVSKFGARTCKPFKEPNNRISSLAGRYNNPICRSGPPGYIGWRNRGLLKRLQKRAQPRSCRRLLHVGLRLLGCSFISKTL
jgi:hypothetical protein